MDNKFQKYFIFSVGIALSVLEMGCGVKGDPQPPLEPPFIGRGEPTYDNAGSELVEESKEKKTKKKSR